MVKINEVKNTATFAWSHTAIPMLATGSAAGVIDDDFSSSSTLEFHGLYDNQPLLSVDADAKFYDLDWSKDNALLAGALENGTVQFWNTEKLTQGTVSPVAKGVKHTGAIKSLQFNPIQHNVLVSGGANGEIYIWDTNRLDNLAPFAPGTAMTPMETVTSVAWNNSVSHIFGAAGSAGYASIWDLKAKKEVLHLTYTTPTGTRASLSTVAWHPTQSTKVITASDADGAPVILTWDLRNSNAPETVLSGHKKGVLSLDWNVKDPTFLLSCGKDNTTMLWNPVSGERLAQYPTTANWAFKTRFSPTAPDVFATSSFDKKVIVQSIQDTSPPVSTRITSVTENDFWNEISTTETQQPEYFIKQAPNWYGRHSSVSFGFGAKIVTISKTGDKSSEIKISKAQLPGSTVNENLKTALITHDFKPIVEARLENSYEDVNRSDWELLGKLSEGNIYEKFIALDIADDIVPPTSGEDFFDNLKQSNSYVPSGELKFAEDSEELTNALLTKNLSKAIDICLENENLSEALIIALNGPESLKKKLNDYYFSKNAEKNPIARLLFSVSSGDVSDIVENGSIAHWKKIGTAINTYSTDKAVYKTQFVKLGDRILANKKRDDAILNYVNASALDKIADIWNAELKDLEKKILTEKNSSAYDAHFESLTEFVEKFGAYRATLNLDAPVNESASSLSTLLEYVDIISTNGQFELASKILSLLSTEVPAVKLELDRIANASPATASSAAANGAQANVGGRYGSLMSSAATGAHQTQRGRPSVAYMAGTAPTMPVHQQVPSYGGYQPSTAAPVVPSQYVPQTPSYGAAPAHNPYMPNAAAAVVPAQTQPSMPPPPPKNPRKLETDGWNDLPSHFHKQQPRRVAAAPSNVSQQTGKTATPPLSRVSSFANGPSLPPPPRSVSKPPKGPSSVENTPVEQPAVISRYAPSPQPNIPSLNNLTGQPQPSALGGAPAAPPKNPYAPTGSGFPPTNAYAPPAQPSSLPGMPPMGNQFGPRPVAPSVAPPPPVSNPYAPSGVPSTGYGVQQSGNGAYGAPPQSNGMPPQQNPYGVPPQPSPLAPPPSVASAPPPQVSNPYAPQAQAPPAMGSAYAPPQMTQAAPPMAQSAPPIAQSAPPMVPQTGGPPPHTQSAPPQAPSKVQYPAGDRSHIPESQKKIFEVLHSTFEAVRSGIPEKYTKQVVDTEKRLNILFDHLNNEDLLTAPTLALMNQLCDQLTAKDFANALNLHLEIMTNHSHEGGHWIVGVKRLIQFAEAVQ